MQAAFRTVFDEGYQQAVIIGSDCLQLTPDHLKEAYRVLEHHDIVIGPARDGGYYLLGMNKLHDALFHDIKWSTEYVFAETVQRINTWQLRYSCLEMLTDVDEETDLPPDWKTRLLYQEKH
jgi:rSAM/selenodomain-associated transferase 1